MVRLRLEATRLARGLLGAALVFLVWLLLHPPVGPSSSGSPSPTEIPPSLASVLTQVAAGGLAAAIQRTADLVRSIPGLADRGGAVAASPVLRDLVLRRWKEAVRQAPDPAAALRDVRFLQRRLAGGCS